jgi:hypothetical protein
MFDEYTPGEDRRQDANCICLTNIQGVPPDVVDRPKGALCAVSTLQWLASLMPHEFEASDIARAALTALRASNDADEGQWGAAASTARHFRLAVNRIAIGRTWHGRRSAIWRRALIAQDQMLARDRAGSDAMFRLFRRLGFLALRAAVREGILWRTGDRWVVIA